MQMNYFAFACSYFKIIRDYLILQLNKVLMPNPFDRPGAVLVLEVRGSEGK